MKSFTHSFPAPVRGWVESENLADNAGLGASVLENGFPLQNTVRARAGRLKVATIGAAVKSLIPYRSGTATKLFAASTTAVYDISALDNDTVPSAAISSLTSGDWSHAQIATAGGEFLVMVNGTDAGRTYNGTSFSTISLTGVTSSTLGHVWLYANRLFFVQKNTMKAWYLPVDSIGGTASDFDLGAVFTQGGSLLFGATVTQDSGSGLADRCVFVSTEGEVAIYEGINPAGAASWSKVGVYSVGRPVSKQTMRAGGDLLIATQDGLVPLSRIVSLDRAALSHAAVSAQIAPAWLRRAKGRSDIQLLKWQRESMGIVGFRHRNEAYVVNLLTGAWAKWTNHDVQCMALHNDLAYFGAADGYVYQFEGTGSDDGGVYVWRMSLLPDHLRTPGQHKQILMARATFRSLAPFTVKLDVQTDYRREFGTPPSVYPDTSIPSLWDTGLWDVARWDDSEDSEERVTATTYWRSIGRSGLSASPQMQVSLGAVRKPDAEFVAMDVLYSVGGVVV